MFNLSDEQMKKVLLIFTFCIAFQLIMGAGFLALISFLWSRYDHDLKLIALTGVISIASQMMATASTLLVGRSLSAEKSNSIPNPIPSNSKFQQTLTTGDTSMDAQTDKS